ncbi:MAG: glycosyltransferase [Anaerolineales bacterium]
MLSYHTCPLATLGGKDTGGMNVYVRDLSRQLGRMGIHVDVFTRSQDEHVPHVLHDLGHGNRVVHVPAGAETPLPKQELASHIPEFVSGILEFSQKKGLQYDLIHSHYWMSGIAARDLKAVWGTPIVHMFHTLGRMKNRVAGVGEAEGDYRIDGEQEVLRVADRIVAATPAELAQLQWLYKANTQKVVIIPPGVDTCHFYPIDPDEAREFTRIPLHHHNVLFVGRIEPLKGIDILIRALGLINGRDQALVHPKHFCVAIIGGDPDASPEEMTHEMTRLQKLRESAGVGEMVTFLGKRSQDTLPYYYSAANVLVMPSHYESFGMVALEAMACGTPVIASQVGGLAFLVKDGETGYHVPGDDPEALADRLMDLLTNDELRAKMGAQAAGYAKHYDWALIAKRLVGVYTDH